MLKKCLRMMLFLIVLVLINVTLLHRSTSAVDTNNAPYLYKTFVNGATEVLQRTARHFSIMPVSQTKSNMFRTKPKFYPFNGTGTTVNISNKYDTNTFNSFCNIDKPPVAILPVYSAPGNFARRRAIRDTVGKDCAILKCRIFFIVGISINETLNRKVKIEYTKERDILIVNKIDTYRDLNNKVVAMLDWLIEYCQEPKYVIHLIDDTYPNLTYLIDHLDTMEVKRFIIGHIISWSIPKRGPGNKWHISQDEYPFLLYPHYIVGTAYAFLNSDCQILRDYVHSVEYCWIEDVWFTGMVANRANCTFIPFKRKYADSVPSLTQYDWSSYAVIHNVSPDDFYDIYEYKTIANNNVI